MDKKAGMKWQLLVLSLVVITNEKASGLKNLQIRVPMAVKSGTPVTMSCTYDLEGAALYSIRWYREDYEFYRYVPKESPPSVVFPLSSSEVDLEASNEQDVRLLGLHKQLTGEYQCEVSADAPLFHTGIKSSYLYIVDYPEYEPVINADRNAYSVGDSIQVNCTSSPSFPAANISWYINDQKVPNTHTWTQNTDSETWETESSFSTLEITTEQEMLVRKYQVGGNILQTSSSQLPVQQSRQEFFQLDRPPEEMQRKYTQSQLRPNLPQQRLSKIQVNTHYGEVLSIRCEATLFDVYTIKSAEFLIKENSPQTALVMEQESSGSKPLPDKVTAIVIILGWFLKILANPFIHQIIHN